MGWCVKWTVSPGVMWEQIISVATVGTFFSVCKSFIERLGRFRQISRKLVVDFLIHHPGRAHRKRRFSTKALAKLNHFCVVREIHRQRCSRRVKRGNGRNTDRRDSDGSGQIRGLDRTGGKRGGSRRGADV